MTNNMIMASSNKAKEAYEIVRSLQERFANKLSILSEQIGENKAFEEVFWLRDNGVHGGGSRFEARDNILFNTGSVNVSQVHYDEDETKSLKSATAISTIIHPKNPNVPSVHIHISLTELRSGKTYWRLMADLNPSLENKDDEIEFTKTMKNISKDVYNEAKEQGDKYFDIPVLNRTRGVTHFYLENYNSGDEKADETLALNFGKEVIDSYTNIISNAFKTRTTFSVQNIQAQLAYHTLYLFQVLTLDRGTTSGLLVHNQNDVGIMGSLPSFINKKLLQSWISKMTKPQDELVEALVNCIEDNGIINEDVKIKLATCVREHYIKYPQALNMQASGNTIPNTVENHTK
jgi:coproporphyrinogen III oxidase